MALAEKEVPKPEKSEKDIEVARKRLQQAVEATNQNRIFQVDDLRFAAASPDNKFQWPEAIVTLRENDPNGARPVLTINKLPQHINQITNEQRQNRPSVKVSPVDDQGDKEVAEVLTGIIRHIEYISDAETAYAVAGENQVIHGEGYVRVLTDFVDEKSFEQEITIHQVKNAFSVYFDPIGLQRDPTGRFCEWVFIVEDLAKDDFEREYPDADPVNWELVGNGDEWKAWFPDSDTVRVAEYFCYVYEEKTLSLFDVMGVPTVHLEGQPVPPGVVTGMQPIKTRKTRVRKVMWQKMNGSEVIEERDWAGSCLPVVRAAGNEWYIDGKMIVSGIVRNAKDAQRMFNYWKSTECETLALAPKSPFVGPAEAFEGFEDQWQTANSKNYSYLKYNQFTEDGKEIERPQRQTPPMPPVGIVNAALGAADDIKSSTGQYDPSLGNNPQAKSGIALQREQRKTDMGTFHYIDNQARAIKQLGRVLVDLIPKIYDTKRVARILGEDGEADQVTLDPESPKAVAEQQTETGVEKIYNPSIGRYDVTVSVGPGFASKRQEAADLMAQVLQGNKELMAVMGDLYFKMLDVPGAEEIAERLKKTLPPGLAESEEDEDGPKVQTPRGPVSVEEAGQIIAALEQSSQQAQEILQSKELKAKEAEAQKAKNDADRLDLERQKEASAQAKTGHELELKERELAVREYEAETHRMTAEAVAHEKGANVKQIEADAAEAMARAQAEVQAMITSQVSSALAPVNEALGGMRELMSAPRELEYDPDGMPIRSRVVMPQPQEMAQ
jgi:hypothetical protein